MHVVIHDNIKKAHAKLTDHVNKSSIKINKVNIENNSVNNANSISKKTHKKLFKNVLKQIISVNKVHMQNNVFDYDKSKKLHKELFNNVLIELKSTNNAGHKDSSANINEASVNDMLIISNTKQIMKIMIYYIITCYTILTSLKK